MFPKGLDGVEIFPRGQIDSIRKQLDADIENGSPLYGFIEISNENVARMMANAGFETIVLYESPKE